MEGSLPSPQTRLVAAWIELHREELMADWRLASQGELPFKIVEHMYAGARAVEPLSDFRLLITFETGERRVFDVKPYLGHGVFCELRDPALFRSVRISFDSVEWANGADLCPEVLYRESVPAGVELLSMKESA